LATNTAQADVQLKNWQPYCGMAKKSVTKASFSPLMKLEALVSSRPIKFCKESHCYVGLLIYEKAILKGLVDLKSSEISALFDRCVTRLIRVLTRIQLAQSCLF